MENILDIKFIENIKSIVTTIFSNLIIDELEVIQDHVIIILIVMSLKYGFDKDNINTFYTLMEQNNNQHIKSVIKLLIPYIDDSNDFELFKQIEKIADISIKKKPNINFREKQDKNPYLISTYQYSRYHDKKHNSNNTIMDNPELDYPLFYEYEFNEMDLETNKCLILDTIELTRTKLLVNWLDILPIVRENYKESRLYKNSFDTTTGQLVYNNKNSRNSENLRYWDGNIGDSMVNYSGISPHDMFNAVHVYLFHEIYNSGTKWLIYEKQINVNEKPVTYLEILNNIINITYLSQDYTTLKSNLQTEINANWKNINILQIPIYQDFKKYVMFKFDLKYCDDTIETNYNYDSKTFYKQYTDVLGKTFDDEDMILDIDIGKIDINTTMFNTKVDDFFSKIPYIVLHDFFNEQIEKFKRTWYGQNMIREKNGTTIITSIIDINDNLESKIKLKNNTFYLTYKNIYNFAKYISITTNYEKANIIDSRSLTATNWEIFFNILNKTANYIDTFKIGKVIRKTYGTNIDINDIKQFQIFIYNNFMNTFKDNVFLIFIGLGLLSEIVPAPELTDKNLLGDNDTKRETELIKRIKQKFINDKDNGEKYLNTEYYLTREKYSKLELYKGRNNIQDDKRISWFEHLTMGKPWYSFFALSLISQITFYHHFLNNRVMMVTGSTGQGKSVVVPILFYYATVALTLNSKTKILSTQALILATKNNSKFMAQNLGVPIEINDLETNNPYIQYSTQNDKHIVKGSETFIKEVTDRTLLEQLRSNPLLKKPIMNKDKQIIGYRDDNLYDVIIIDEAHMHNVSMDIILTLMRNILMINNQIRLVITSATMEEDEFIYRRFYKNVNDNYMFPMFSKRIPDSTIIMDRSCVDRRFHISPPGESSRYTVTDIYLEKNTESYEEAEKKGIETVNDIINKTNGDILFFTTSTNNVKKLVRLFNSNTESHIIALPLYSKMREIQKNIKWFDMISDIAKTKKDIQYEKMDIMDVIEMGDVGFQKVNSNKFTRAIIVATPVVEASVTIDSLKIVIDTGYVVNINFDIAQNKSIQTVDMISDASRMQRRGRVGRTSSGTVYYMYVKDSHAHIKSNYELVTKDITTDLFNILSTEGDKPFIDFDKHPQNFDFDNKNETYNEFWKNESNDIKNIYDKQYNFTLAKNLDDHPFINTYVTSTPTNLSKEFGVLYKDGYGITDLLDIDGMFYIIHPGELYIKRNVITGTIIESRDIMPKKYSIRHYEKISFSLQKMHFLKYIYYDKHFDIVNVEKYTADKFIHKHAFIHIINDIIKDEGGNLSDIMNNFPEDEMIKVIKTIFTGYKFNCLERVIRIIALMYSIGTYKTFIRKQDNNPKRIKMDEFKKMWANDVSELFSYENIMNKFISSIQQYNPIKKINIKKIDNEEINKRYIKYEEIFKKKGMALFADIKNINDSELSIAEIQLFTESKNERWDNKKREEKYNTLAKNTLSIVSVEMYAKLCHIDDMVINKAINLYNKLKKLIEKETVINAMEQFKDIYIINRTSDNLIMSFMDNYGSNLLKYENGQFSYILNNNQISNPKISLMNFFPSYYFITILSEEDVLGLTAVSVETIQKTFHLASYGNINNKYVDKIKQSDNITNITGKTNIVKTKNKSLDMNNIIKADLNFK